MSAHGETLGVAHRLYLVLPRTTVELNPTALAVADFDGDGKTDLGVANTGDGSIGVDTLRNDTEDFDNPFVNNDNGFSLPFTPPTGLSDAVAVQTGEINGDGWPDMIALNLDGDTLGIYLNTGPQPTATPTSSPTATPTRTPVPTLTPTRAVPPPQLSIGSGEGLPGHSVDIAVSLLSSGASIAATANDITFETQALSLDPSACRINPAISKSLIVTVLDPGTGGGAATLRFFVTADRNVSPIPDGPLYTCTFGIARAALPFVYALFNENTFAFSPTGMSVDPVSAADGSVLVSLVAPAGATPTPRAAVGDGGCTLSAARAGSYPLAPATLLLALVGIVLARRRR